MRNLLPILLLISFLFPGQIHAQATECQKIYGGGEIVCNNNVKFSIDKKVMTAGKGGTFVDNLTMSDPKLNPGEKATFQITVKNTGNNKISHIDVVDMLPTELTFDSGNGKFDAASRRVTFGLDNLEKSQSKSFSFVARVENLTANSAECPKNTVRAAEKSGATAQDSSQLCLNKPSQVVTQNSPQVLSRGTVNEIPNTGPEMAVLPLLGAAGVLGFYLRKKA